MELCTSTRCISNRLPNLPSFTPYRTCVQWKFSLPLKPNSISRNNTGSRHYNYSSIKASSSDETSIGANQYVKEEPDVLNYSPVESTNPDETSNGANQYVKEEPDVANYSPIESTNPDETSNGSNQYVNEEPDSEVTVNEVESEEKSGFGGFSLFKDDATSDEQFPQFDFLNKLNMELDLEDSFSIALLGVGGVAALWLTASIVGAIDNIPLFPKLMEVVGLGYTIWFSTRYLLFKKNRDELGSKIEDIKQQVLGSKN
ncbi:hypothetical protein L2E82_34249 [Cichorium intybus]|uniref:Uncharacterized protein n=1 Tax=Cichorium intybus TaxID=13427 RepID=A0ACB9BLU0_CICIN|nr:hypothetical protein L2E82_34249 [Cichorium intybus]